MEYPFQCDCGAKTVVSGRMSCPPRHVECVCGKPMRRVYGGFHFHVTGKQEPYAFQGGHPKAVGINIAERIGRSPQQQIKEYSKAFAHEQRIARARDRDMSKFRRDMQCRKIGSIPREAWIARTRQHGKNYWHSDDPKSLAKRDGFLF